MNILEYEKIIEQTTIYPKQVGLMYCALGLSGEAGEVAEKVKKLIRDTNYLTNKELTEEFKLSLAKELGDVIWYATAICNEIDLSLSQILLMNYEKLTKRRETGTLSGSGDDREESKERKST